MPSFQPKDRYLAKRTQPEMTSEDIEQHVQEFLQKGGKIDVRQQGESGDRWYGQGKKPVKHNENLLKRGK